MPALSNPKREAFALLLLRNLIDGQFKYRGDAALAAAKAVGYRGSALKDNARKWANEPDIKARMTEVASPVRPESDEELPMLIGEAKLMLAKIARDAKPADRIGSIRQLALMEGWEAPKRHEHKHEAPLIDPAKLNDEQLAALESIWLAAGSVAIAADDPIGEAAPKAEGQLH